MGDEVAAGRGAGEESEKGWWGWMEMEMERPRWGVSWRCLLEGR